MALERLGDGQLAGGDPPRQLLVDGAVVLAALPRAVLDELYLAGGGLDVPLFDAVALAAGDIDRREHVAHPAGPGAEMRRGRGLVDKLDRGVDVVDNLRPPKAGTVADPDERVRGVGHLLGDAVGDLVGGQLEGGHDRVAAEDGHARPLAGIDPDDGPAVVAPQDADGRLDGAPRVGRVGPDGRHLGMFVLGADESHPGVVGQFGAGLDGGEPDVPVAERLDGPVIELEVVRRDDDHCRDDATAVQ